MAMPSGAAGQSAQLKQNFDRDILMLRNTVAPDFRHKYDDYTQYAPNAGF